VSILANCGLVQFFNAADIETAEWLQRRGGTMTGESTSRSYTSGLVKSPRGESRNDSRIPLLPFESMMSLPQDQSIVFFAGNHDPLIVGRRPYWTIPRLAEKYDDSPFHMP
jgi:type IV secretion system protein VirD4